MSFTTLITPAELAPLIGSGDLLILDCRHDLADLSRGQRAYTQGHIPGAQYADLNRDLSDLSKPGLGRHPLPDASAFAMTLARWGYYSQQQVVVYDDAGGAIAARAWWMLRLIGHDAVAVLDGGMPAWLATGLVVDSVVPQPEPTQVAINFKTGEIVYFDELSKKLQSENVQLLDARGAPRFRGEVEPLDTVAGHIPGAINRPFSSNLAVDGSFKSAPLLRDEFSALLGVHSAHTVIHSCGSGVTACHNLLAMEHAGLVGSRVFAPSWSGWISDPTRPVARGE
ncbi:sulfurtransferase [Pseudolysobacter antarcticus]|uniref:Sulfurtransferase n=1 Tax=Pseudolysobacter antarcticus TaxID=2511995 RepID=A0A411HK68_9GAMM|nr:sulfurtransferase [Pseudolysobacter antarcticus]QBB70903.1 sulfurtransferase [Pseudolysobacter antarcticus]